MVWKYFSSYKNSSDILHANVLCFSQSFISNVLNSSILNSTCSCNITLDFSQKNSRLPNTIKVTFQCWWGLAKSRRLVPQEVPRIWTSGDSQVPLVGVSTGTAILQNIWASSKSGKLHSPASSMYLPRNVHKNVRGNLVVTSKKPKINSYQITKNEWMEEHAMDRSETVIGALWKCIHCGHQDAHCYIKQGELRKNKCCCHFDKVQTPAKPPRGDCLGTSQAGSKRREWEWASWR